MGLGARRRGRAVVGARHVRDAESEHERNDHDGRRDAGERAPAAHPPARSPPDGGDGTDRSGELIARLRW
jgi:hypothetical protein